MRLGILKCGDAAEPVRLKHGNYDKMFLQHLTEVDASTQVYDAVSGTLPSLDDVDAVIITGSPASVTEPEPWVDRLAAWCRQAMQAELPILGVCYGHQVLAYAAGGSVRQNPRGFELGTWSVELNDQGAQDKLLGPLATDGVLRMQQVHGDEVDRLPDDAVVLAKNDVSAVQAFRLGDRTWGVQFHPEMTLPIMQDYVGARANLVRDGAERAGKDPDAEVERARASLTESPAGPRLLARFVELSRL